MDGCEPKVPEKALDDGSQVAVFSAGRSAGATASGDQ